MSAELDNMTKAELLSELRVFARSEDRRRAMLAGFDIHLSKPVEPGELVAVVARLALRNTTDSILKDES